MPVIEEGISGYPDCFVCGGASGALNRWISEIKHFVPVCYTCCNKYSNKQLLDIYNQKKGPVCPQARTSDQT